MEYWNLYDYNGKKKNKIAIRGTKLNNDDFHLDFSSALKNYPYFSQTAQY